MLSENILGELQGIEKVNDEDQKYISASDNPSIVFQYKFLQGENYRIEGKLLYGEGCFPQPTLKFYNPKTNRSRFVALYFDSMKNYFDLNFTMVDGDDIVMFVPFFQKGNFELPDLKIGPVSGIKLRYLGIKGKIRPKFNFFKYRFLLVLLAFRLLFTEGPKSTFRKILSQIKRNYSFWILFFDRNDWFDRIKTRKLLKSLKRVPKISIVMPVYDVEKAYLVKAIDSIRNQVYQNWELCIADDCSTKPYIQPFLKEMAAKDPRIKVVFRKTNGHISEATNSALAVATGEFIALMDNDDILVDSALVYVAQSIEFNPDCALVYSDEDKINERDRRFSPFFKPDWSPELFFSMNILTHLNVFRADLVKKMGGFRNGYEGSQDYDFCLRFIEQIRDDQIIHIPRILYHWRAIEGSVALDSREKQYAHQNARRAITEYYERRGESVTVGSAYGPLHRVQYNYNKNLHLVSIIICTRDAREILRTCIDSIIQKTTFTNYEIIVVDNSSEKKETLEYFEELKKLTFVKVIRIDCPFNYSFLNNEAVKHASGEILCFLNNDIEIISPEWLDELVMHVQRPEIGAVGARLLYPNGTIQHFGIVTGMMGGVAGHPFKFCSSNSEGYFGRLRVVGNVSAVTGACLVTKKEIFEKVSGFDVEHLSIAYNDVDLCLKILALNYRIVVTPFAELIHHESLTRGAEDTPEKKGRLNREKAFMIQKWGKSLDDRYYNPNLTINEENYSLAWPPRKWEP